MKDFKFIAVCITLIGLAGYVPAFGKELSSEMRALVPEIHKAVDTDA